MTIIFLAVLAGCTVVYYVSHSFKGSVHTDNTEIKVIDTENCPSVIKEKYYLSELSEDFEVTDSISTPFYEYTSYQNKKITQNKLLYLGSMLRQIWVLSILIQKDRIWKKLRSMDIMAFVLFLGPMVLYSQM